MHRGKASSAFAHGYVPIYQGETSDFLVDNSKFALTSEACPTALAANQTGTMAVVAYSDDSLMLHDVRSLYQERMRLEVGGHTNTVKSIVFSQQKGVDFLCLTGGADGKLKLWDLRQRRAIKDYGEDEFDSFHDDSIWHIQPINSNFDSVFTGGRDGMIFSTDLGGDDEPKLLYSGGKTPITALNYDARYDKVWFATSNDSSIKFLDF